MQLPSPNEGKEPKKIEGHDALYYDHSHKQAVIDWEPIDPEDPKKGVRPVEKIIDVPDNPEVVDLRTGQSNTKYWQPEKIVAPEGCEHEFIITSIGKREIECPKCNFATSFIAGVNFFEESGKFSVKIRNHLYPVSK